MNWTVILYVIAGIGLSGITIWVIVPMIIARYWVGD